MGIKSIGSMKRFWGLLNGPRGWIPQDLQVICDKCGFSEEGWTYFGFAFKDWYGIGSPNKFSLLCPNCIKKEQQKAHPNRLSVLKIELVKN